MAGRRGDGDRWAGGQAGKSDAILDKGGHTFSVKDQIVNSLGLVGRADLVMTAQSASTAHKQPQGTVNEWLRLRASQTLFTQTGRWLDVATTVYQFLMEPIPDTSRKPPRTIFININI